MKHLSSRKSHPEGSYGKPKDDENKEDKLVVDFDASGNVIIDN
tara:strand:- start:2670 stop:2798 length:129 start_codon:yes stop_codon:yes gene_type:complete